MLYSSSWVPLMLASTLTWEGQATIHRINCSAQSIAVQNFNHWTDLYSIFCKNNWHFRKINITTKKWVFKLYLCFTLDHDLYTVSYLYKCILSSRCQSPMTSIYLKLSLKKTGKWDRRPRRREVSEAAGWDRAGYFIAGLFVLWTMISTRSKYFL